MKKVEAMNLTLKKKAETYSHSRNECNVLKKGILKYRDIERKIYSIHECLCVFCGYNI